MTHLFLECVAICFEAISFPSSHPDISSEEWSFDRETVTKAQGLLSSIQNFSFLMALVTVRKVTKKRFRYPGSI